MEIKTMSFEDTEARLSEIKLEMDKPEADLAELRAEVEEIEARRAELTAQEAERRALADQIAKDDVPVVVVKDFTEYQIKNHLEHLKYIKQKVRFNKTGGM